MPSKCSVRNLATSKSDLVTKSAVPMRKNLPRINFSSFEILEALTRRNCEETFSLETFETLGDSFLKYAVSRHLFVVHSQKHEGQLTKKRMSQTSNYHLYKLAVENSITGYIYSEKFEIKKWQAPGYIMRGGSLQASDELQNTVSAGPFNFEELKKNHSVRLRILKSKAVADVVEALIGAHLEYGSQMAALAFMIWLGIEVNIDLDLNCQVTQDIYINTGDIFYVNSLCLLLEAVTHASFQDSNVGCYQRLEFLGDAVLDFLLTYHLLKTHASLNPGLLSDLRSAATNNDCYGKVAVKWNLQKYLRHASGSLHNQITEFLGLMHSSRNTANETFG